MDYFSGKSKGTVSTSLFVSLEAGQKARGVYMGTVPSGRADIAPQPVIFSPRTGKVMVWPSHLLLLQALESVQKYTPVQISCQGKRGRTTIYTVEMWAPLPKGERAELDKALEATTEELERIRGIAAKNSGTKPAPTSAAGALEEEDDDLPF